MAEILLDRDTRLQLRAQAHGLEPAQGLAMLMGVYNSGVWAGGISAILVNTPGTPASIMTVLDGYAMTKRGEAGLALGINVIYSAIGGLISTVFLMFAAFPIARFALRFGPAEYFALALFGHGYDRVESSCSKLPTGVDAQKLRNGNLTDSDWERLVEGAEGVASSNLIIDDTPGITLAELRSKCRKYKLENQLGIIMIDYLQLMSGGGRGSESRQQEISDISRGLKSLARELNVPVVALSQLSRAVEQRPDHRPMLSDLRESGAIEQDADMVMFLYRDSYYNKDTEMKNLAEVIVAKQRNGPVGTINLLWMPEYTTFKNFKPGPPI